MSIVFVVIALLIGGIALASLILVMAENDDDLVIYAIKAALADDEEGDDA